VTALRTRLRSAISLVPTDAAVVADIGAGHGALCAGLATRTTARLIATEVAMGPLRELRDNIHAWSLSDRVEVRWGSGLAPLAPGEADTVVIAGVGAPSMLAIAAQAPERGVRWLVLQCMQRDDLVAPWLSRRGWRVLACDVAVQRSRRYTARLVEVGM
jgi:tRNA (adenine22-N1)-methyltransferase